MSGREIAELRYYLKHHPIDDQANFHVPIASLQATVQNLMGGKAKMIDNLLYREREDEADDDEVDEDGLAAVDRLLLSGKGW